MTLNELLEPNDLRATRVSKAFTSNSGRKTLLFVGFQISDGNRETRAATIQAALDSEIAVNTEMMRYADTWEKVSTGEPIPDSAERRRAIVLFNSLMTIYENRYFQYQSGYIEQEPNVFPLIRMPFFGTWRESGGARNRAPGFLEYIDGISDRFQERLQEE